MRNSAKYLLATAGIYLLTAGHPAADSIPVQILDPNLKVTTVLNAGIAQPIGIVFLGANDFLVLEKASGQVKRVIGGVIQATPVLDLAVNSALRARAAQPCACTRISRRRRGSTSAGPRAAPAPTPASVLDVPLLGNRVDRYVWNGTTLTFDRNIDHRCGRCRPTTSSCPAIPAPPTPARTATTTAA